MDNMSFGGVTKLPQGGVAFTHHRRISDNAWGNTLYVTDSKYNITGKYPVCASPMAPKVINNVLMVGSSAMEQGAKHKFHLYNTSDFSLIKEFLFEDMVDAWQITEYENYAYFGVTVTPQLSDKKYSYIVQLDCNSSNITEFYDENDFFDESTFGIYRQGPLLYVLNGRKKDMAVVNLNTQKVESITKTSLYPEIANKNAWNFFHPKFINGSLYGVLGGFFEQNGNGYYYAYVVKLNGATFALENIKPLQMPINSGDTGASNQFYAGRFLVQRIENHVLFIDVESGEIVEQVVLDVY
jgi:hypothetical protein